MAVRTTFVRHVLLIRSLRSVFEERLRKDISDGSNLVSFTIKFVFNAQPPEGPAQDEQSAVAVNQTTEAIGISGSTPAIADLHSAVDNTFATQPPEANTLRAVTQATEATGTLGSTPAVVGLLASTIGAGTTVVTEVQTFETIWGVLLDRLELFDKIVTNIVAVTVFILSSPLSHSLNLVGSSVYVAGMVCHICREQSPSVPHNSCIADHC